MAMWNSGTLTDCCFLGAGRSFGSRAEHWLVRRSAGEFYSGCTKIPLVGAQALRTPKGEFMLQAFITHTPPSHGPRTKVRAALLACFFGWLGAHWWYLGRRGAWLVTLFAVLCLAATRLFPVWYDNPAFFLLFVPMTDGFIESVIFCLRSDASFDSTYNPGLGQPSHTGWGPIVVAIVATLMGAVCTMFGVAMVVVYVWSAMGWLDGYVL
jgi:hypothetical protein